jgi:hypothetical protein
VGAAGKALGFLYSFGLLCHSFSVCWLSVPLQSMSQSMATPSLPSSLVPETNSNPIYEQINNSLCLSSNSPETVWLERSESTVEGMGIGGWEGRDAQHKAATKHPLSQQVAILKKVGLDRDSSNHSLLWGYFPLENPACSSQTNSPSWYWNTMSRLTPLLTWITSPYSALNPCYAQSLTSIDGCFCIFKSYF